VLTAEGATIVAGRSRGNGRRSRLRLEPIILGEIRGAGTRIHSGGAPTANGRHDMVMHLALDWRRATGEDPRRGRSDETGFGDLVHSVFQWLKLSKDPTEAAAYALRRFWSLMRRRKDQAASLVEVPVCADCRWAQRGASRDDFLCRKLSIACTMAREAGQSCGPEGVLFAKQTGIGFSPARSVDAS
jgi:hypothetical protein